MEKLRCALQSPDAQHWELRFPLPNNAAYVIRDDLSTMREVKREFDLLDPKTQRQWIKDHIAERLE